jgi:hypothetical protein
MSSSFGAVLLRFHILANPSPFPSHYNASARLRFPSFAGFSELHFLCKPWHPSCRSELKAFFKEMTA